MEAYKELIDNFIKTLPENGEDNKELIDNFTNFLSDTVSHIIRLEPQYKDNKDFISRVVSQRAEYVTSLTIDGKRSYLIRDLMFEKLQDISNKIYKQAVKKAEGKKVEFDEEKYESMKKELDDALKQVEPFNIDKAKNIYSESLLDIAYLSGGDIASLRIGHIIRNLREQER